MNPRKYSRGTRRPRGRSTRGLSRGFRGAKPDKTGCAVLILLLAALPLTALTLGALR